MKLKALFGRKALAALLGAVLAVTAGLYLRAFNFGNGLTNASYDLLLVARGDKRVGEAVIVYLDEASHLKLNQPLNAPWDRALHAKLIDRLSEAGAKAIVFDIVFSDPNPDKAEADQQFADAIRRSGRVVLAADNVPDGPGRNRIIPPFDLLLNQAAAVGSAETTPSSDLIIRVHTPREASPLSSLAWATAEYLQLPATKPAGAENRERWVNYYGQPGLLPWHSYHEALDSTVVPDEFFHDKIVFVGSRIMTKFAGERKDEYPSPFSEWLGKDTFMSGVEIQATMFVNLLRNDWLQRFSPAVEKIMFVLLGVCFGVGLLLFRPLWATALALAGFAALALTGYWLIDHKLLWLPLFIAGLQIAIALAWSVLFNSVQLYVQKRLAEQSLSLYLSPKLVKKFAADPTLLKPGAHKQVVTLFFSDIAGFTSISEGMDSDHLAQLMNNYFETAVSKCIHKTDGTVVKYIGDAIFAFWNAPEPQVDHELRACQAALHFRDTDDHAINGTKLHTRIGLHTGLANVGNFGGVERVDYTALGENVNLASRLEGLNKYLGTSCLISGQTKMGIGDQLVTRFLGRFRLKGFERAVEVYELVGWPPEAEITEGWREAFANGLTFYQQGRFDEAASEFERTLRLRPEDGPAGFYRARIAEVRMLARPEDWTADIELKEK